MANRMVDSARGLLTRFIPDVYLYTDVYKGVESGSSPGYALCLVAESTTGVLVSTECAYQPRKRLDKEPTSYEDENSCSSMLVNDYTFPTPEDLGVRAARQLMVEIKKGIMLIIYIIGGSVDSLSQWLNILYLALGPEDVGKIRVGSLTPFT
jgi:RNA 3'-terminal phosphate cyclase-like protein